MNGMRILICFLFVGWLSVPAQAQNQFDTLLICPVEFQAALTEWIEYREAQGHRIRVEAPAATAAGIKLQVRRVATRHPIEHLFLIGDPGQEIPRPDVIVPTDYVDAKVNVLFGSERHIATDNTYADLDDDGLPELTLGRLPVDSPEEVQQFVQRVIDYEQNQEPDQQWRRNVNFVAGIGGFGGMIDNVIETSTRKIITDLIPEDYRTSMTFGSWRSPYCPDPRRFSETAIRRFNEGCMFWVYIGHGHPYRLDQVRFPDRNHSILDVRSAKKISCSNGSPIAIFLACYAGAADARGDCIAETMIRQPNGPIATISGSRVTMPYALSLMSLEMIREYFDGDAKTLGELTMLAKHRMVCGDDESNEYRETVQALGKLFSPRPELLREECLEHMHLIQLFGDPLLRIKRPRKIELDSIRVVESGTTCTIRGVTPESGNLTVELVYRRDRFLQRPVPRKVYVGTDEVLEGYQETYEQANELTCNCKTIFVPAGPFEIPLEIPDNAGGRCAVRCMLNSSESFGLGSTLVEVRRPTLIREAKAMER